MSEPAKAVFLSYARDDAAAARRIAEALRSAGLEVWFDENELRGGDQWDAKIRKQIDACALFVAVVSQHTQERSKGYFRLEWKLAVDQTHLLAEGVPFIAPVVIDDTRESRAVVPPEFMKVQWSRLPGALPTPQFVEQVKRLLAGPVSRGGSGSRPTAAGSGDLALQKKGLPGWTWGALVAVVVGIGVALSVSRKPEPAAVPAPIAPAVVAAPAPKGEVHRLVEKAKALHEDFSQDDTLRDNLILAEQICQRAVELDPTDGEAWAAYARISLSLSYSDTTNNRLEQGFSQVQRALKLAPDSIDVKLAHAEALRKQGAASRPEAERILRELAAKAAGDRRVLRMLALLLNSEGRLDEALVYFDRASALPGGDAKALLGRANILFRLQRYAEAEATVNDSLALRPTASGRMVKMWFLMRRGELEAARNLLATVPAASLTEDRAAYLSSRLWLWLGEPDKALAILRAAPRDYFDDAWTGGLPKGYLTGWALQLGGRPEAAQSEWRAALQLVDRRLERSPNELGSLSDRCLLLALLGRTDEALKGHRVFEQLSEGQIGEPSRNMSAARVLVLAGRLEEGLKRLEALPRAWTKIAQSYILNYTSALRFDPEWASVRNDPRFQGILKELEAKK